MWLTLMLSAVFGAFGIGQKWANENSRRDNARPAAITSQLLDIQASLGDINSRVIAMEGNG